MDRNLDRRVEAARPRRGRRRAGAARRDPGPDARRRPALVAAPAGRHLGPDRDPRGPARARSTPSRRSRRSPWRRAPSRTCRAGPAPAPARSTRTHDVAAAHGRPAPMTETAEPASRPIETELKYRVSDVDAAARYLTAPTVGPFSGNASTRSTADGGPLRRHGRRRLPPRRASRSASGITGTGTIVSVKSRAKRDGAGGAMRREEIEGPADRALGPFEWPASDARSLVLELGGDAPLVEVVTVRQMRRRRQLRDRGHARRAEPRRRRRRGPRPGRRALRGARGGAAPGERGAARRPGGLVRPRSGARPIDRQQAGDRARRGPGDVDGDPDAAAAAAAEPAEADEPERGRCAERRRRPRRRSRGRCAEAAAAAPEPRPTGGTGRRAGRSGRAVSR